MENLDPNGDIRVLTVKWKDFIIGYLMQEKGTGYYFKYDAEGLKEARRNGYSYLVGFKDSRKVYASKELFPTFKSRVPSRQRRDISDKLNFFGMKEYDEFDYLVASKGALHTDLITLEEDFNPRRMGNKDFRRRALQNGKKPRKVDSLKEVNERE